MDEQTTDDVSENGFKDNEPAGRRTQSPANPYVIPFSVIVAGALIAGAVMYSGKSAPSGTLPAAQVGGAVAQPPADLTDLEGDAPFLGNPDAPVTVVEFADFQCPFCGRFHATAAKQIIDTYVKTGKVKLVYRDFAFLGEESGWAAEAAHCAGDQGKFWEYHDYLYEHQAGENAGAFTKENLKRFAAMLGLATSQFASCLDSGTYTQRVKDNTAAGQRAGTTGTPTTFINGRVVSGAQPFSAFEGIIEEELKKN